MENKAENFSILGNFAQVFWSIKKKNPNIQKN